MSPLIYTDKIYKTYGIKEMVIMNKEIEGNKIKKCYGEYLYWENKIINDNNLWQGYFEDNNITDKSIIVYTGIFNLEKDILKMGWVVYPDVNSFLGFLQYVFIPTVYFNLFDKKENEFLTPISKFSIVVNEINKYNGNCIRSTKMESYYYYLEDLWNKSNEEILLGINKFVVDFNEYWNEEPKSKSFIKFFNQGKDIYSFIKKTIGWDFEEFVESEIEMSLGDLEYTCNNILEKPLINRKIIHLLNSKIVNLF